MADRFITSSNATLFLTATGLFAAPQQIKGFSSDTMFTSDAIDIAETSMGVDGKLSAGYVPVPVSQTITLQADSSSRDFFSTLIAATKVAKNPYFLSGEVTIPGTGEKFSLTRGVLQNLKQLPDLKKTLQPVDFKIIWESVDRSLV